MTVGRASSSLEDWSGSMCFDSGGVAPGDDVSDVFSASVVSFGACDVSSSVPCWELTEGSAVGSVGSSWEGCSSLLGCLRATPNTVKFNSTEIAHQQVNLLGERVEFGI